MWPFSKKNDTVDAPEATSGDTPSVESAESVIAPQQVPATVPAADPNRGPFDGDEVAIEEFDFSDFSDGVLDLGSIKIPMPRPSEVQVEMGPDGPRMVHLVTKVGRVTPVAFASALSGGLWQDSIAEIQEGMRRDGLEAELEEGPWGPEIVGKTEHATIRMIGAEGNRWTLRVTLAAPNETAADLALLGREIIARTFVYRGENPMMAGTVLPVVMPAPLVEQVQQAMRERAAQGGAPIPTQESAQAPTTPADSSPVPDNQGPEVHPDSGSALQQMQARDAQHQENEGR